MKKYLLLIILFTLNISYTYAQKAKYDIGITSLTTFEKSYKFPVTPYGRHTYTVITPKHYKSYWGITCHLQYPFANFLKSELSIAFPIQISAFAEYDQKKLLNPTNYLYYAIPLELRYTYGKREHNQILNKFGIGGFVSTGVAETGYRTQNRKYDQRGFYWSVGLSKQVGKRCITLTYLNMPTFYKKYEIAGAVMSQESVYYIVEPHSYGLHSIGFLISLDKKTKTLKAKK